MKPFITLLFVILLSLAACTGSDFDASGEMTVTFTCEVNNVGGEISLNEKSKKTTLLLWMSGGFCDFDDE